MVEHRQIWEEIKGMWKGTESIENGKCKGTVDSVWKEFWIHWLC